MQFPLSVDVEGLSDKVVVEKILNYVGLDHHPIQSANGKSNIVEVVGQKPKSYLHKCNEAARFLPSLVIIDLDDETCPVTYRNTLLPQPSKMMVLRIAVRETEAWLLADRERIAKYLNVAVKNVPQDPDAEVDPKQSLLSLVRRKSPKSSLYRDMIPSDHSHRRVGPAYPGRIADFVNHPEHSWRPDIAEHHSDSLHRCLNAHRRLRD